MTDLPFLNVPESVINSRYFDSDPEQWRLVGEVPDWYAKREYNGRWSAPPGLTGKHTCHSEWFGSGEPWPVTLPNTVYDDEWIPECCEREAEGAQGGMAMGGECGDIGPTEDATQGGFQTGGEDGDVNTPPPVPGPNCGSAAQVVTGITYSAPLLGGVQHHWWHYTVPNGVYTLTITIVGGTGDPFTIARPDATSCAALGAPVVDYPAGAIPVTVTNGNLYVDVFALPGPNVLYTILLT